MYPEMDFIVRQYTSRVELRKIVVSKFLEEEPGIGRGSDASHYSYNVETLSNGRRVYLSRPAYYSHSNTIISVTYLSELAQF